MRNLTVNNPSHAGGAHRANTRSARRRAREFALQGIYSWLLRGDGGTQDAGEIDAHIRDADAFSEADAEWFKTLLHGVFQEAAPLREKFEPYIDRPLDELSPIEHSILLIGSYELVFHVERSEEHTSELQSLMRISYAVFCLK